MIDIDKIEAYAKLDKERLDRMAEIYKSDAQILILCAEIRRLREALKNIQNHVNKQSEDEGLWSLPCDSNGNLKLQPIGEAYLQKELRDLHRTIEREALGDL